MQNPVSIYDSMTKMTSISLTVCVRHFNDTIVVLFDTKIWYLRGSVVLIMLF